ncbi:MAG: PfkB family carbohydrate kinase [Alphaproteobacteria bacterium]|nr:PfkB family carbohydrate kinase [Alphaproteobacteria bacterium]
MRNPAKRIGNKICTIDELVGFLGTFPRPKRMKVIMCHGVFDIVHPGHLRHLLYAKSKADVLVASITADRHIVKGTYRPHVPQDLRAQNLAALEMVDYVVIDDNPTPLENIRRLQPDFFAKGYEYIAQGVQPKTSEEAEIVGSYGGQMMFTPGDVVFSSSRLIEQGPPRLGIEKLLALMKASDLSFGDIRASLEAIRESGPAVHVIGDTIVDTITRTSMLGAQGKTPTISVLYDTKEDYVGGAGIVAKHMRAAGAQVTFSTVLGDDALKDFVLEDLAEAGVKVDATIDATRPTTNKNAIVANDYRLLKIDTLDNRSIDDRTVESMAKSIGTSTADILVFSDFRHGIFNSRTIPSLIAAIPPDAFKVADSQIASRWGNITDFKGFDLITPNEKEARFTLADQDTGVRPLSIKLFKKAECKTLIMKMGPRGILTVWDSPDDPFKSAFTVDSFVDDLIDPVGAGDALLAYSALSQKITGSSVVASIVGSFAAACECERDGNIPVTTEAVLKKLDQVERQAAYDYE